MARICSYFVGRGGQRFDDDGDAAREGEHYSAEGDGGRTLVSVEVGKEE